MPHGALPRLVIGLFISSLTCVVAYFIVLFNKCGLNQGWIYWGGGGVRGGGVRTHPSPGQKGCTGGCYFS